MFSINMAVNGGLIGRLALFLGQFAGYAMAFTLCQGGSSLLAVCTDPAMKCCYGRCCHVTDYYKFPFSTCSNSASPGGVQTCLGYPTVSCCPYKISSRDMGKSCCEPATTYTSCPGISETEYCTVKRKDRCCYTRCCDYWEHFSFPFSECSGKYGAQGRYTRHTCYDYPNTQCCTLTHSTGTERSSVFCCSSRYLTDFQTYNLCLFLSTSSGCYDHPDHRSCSWTTTTDYCTHSKLAKCCAYGCCNSPSFSKCGIRYPWPACTDYRSPSCCNVESKGNIVNQTCCHPTMIIDQGNGDNQKTIIGWVVGVSVTVLVFITVCAAHAVVAKRRARNRNMRLPTMPMELTVTAQATPPLSESAMDEPPPSYETVQEQPPQYDQIMSIIDHEQPPSYNDAVNPVFSLSENDLNAAENNANV